MNQQIINSFKSSSNLICKDHLNLITDPSSGEIICSNCGSVLTDKVLESDHAYNYNFEDIGIKSRTGGPTSLAKHDRGLSTMISSTNKDASGRDIAVNMRNRINRWKTWNFRIQNYNSTDKSLHSAFTHLAVMKDSLGLPESVIEKIAYLYRKIQEKKLVKGRTIKGVLAVAVYITCREMGIPRTLREIADITDLREKDVSRIYRKVVLEFNFSIPRADPIKNVVKIANKCNISEKSKRYGIKLMEEIVKREISAGRGPMGLVGAVLYLACKKNNEDITQSKISQITGVTEVTIRHNIQAITDILQISPSK